MGRRPLAGLEGDPDLGSKPFAGLVWDTAGIRALRRIPQAPSVRFISCTPSHLMLCVMILK